VGLSGVHGKIEVHHLATIVIPGSTRDPAYRPRFDRSPYSTVVAATSSRARRRSVNQIPMIAAS
jgi:hypothetical protein